MNSSRRNFLWQGGLAVAGAAGLVLRADARPTPGSGELGAYRNQVEPPARAPAAEAKLVLPDGSKATEDNILGPYHRENAPFRAKITPPLEPGKVMLVKGRVWGLDSKKPLPNTVIDIWQANAKGRYDNDDEKNPPAKDVFLNRARLLTDETGYYEYETVHPGPYQIGEKQWRPSHIHYYVRTTGYKPLVTQLYFKGDPHNKSDEFIKQSLIIELTERKVNGGVIEAGSFDIVLEPAKAAR
jgi:catechol 1,2-dioxygenase